MADSGEEELVSSLYISLRSSNQYNPQNFFTKDNLEDVVRSLEPSGIWQIKETECGFIAAFSADSDADKLMGIDLAAALGGPIKVARFSASDTQYRQAVILHNVPAAIPLQDIVGALLEQGIIAGDIRRIGKHVRVEVLHEMHYESLLRHGVNFFGATRFTAIAERITDNVTTGNSGPNSSGQQKSLRKDDIVQCYRCQEPYLIQNCCNRQPPTWAGYRKLGNACCQRALFCIGRNSLSTSADTTGAYLMYTKSPAVSSSSMQEISNDLPGFWHVAANCQNLPRCVRCGELHSVQFCTRARSDPKCLNCGGAHHAAFRRCPVRLQQLDSLYVSITLSSSTPATNQLHTGTQYHQN